MDDIIDDLTPVDPSEFDDAIWMESSDLMYGRGAMWNIPAAPVHKAFDEANAALSELKSFVEIQLQNDDFRLWDAMEPSERTRRTRGGGP